MPNRPPGDTIRLISALLAPLAGRKVLDIGCGRGVLLSALAEHGARIAGVEPDEVALDHAFRLLGGADLRRGTAQNLPFLDDSVDAAVFLNSLHHVPVRFMPDAIAEAVRVVGRGGDILIVEPLAEGSFFEAMRPIEDETEVRAAAQRTIRQVLRTGFLRLLDCREYERVERYASVAAFIQRVVAVDPARAERAREQRTKVAERFDRLSELSLAGHVLRQPLRLHHLRVPGERHPPEGTPG